MRLTSLARRPGAKAIIAALPAAALALICGASLVLVTTASAGLEQAHSVVRRAATLGAAAASLADAIQDAELAQRSFLAESSIGRQDEFRDALQRVDHLLVSPSMLDLAAAVDRDLGGNVESLIVARMQVLATQAAIAANDDETPLRVQPTAAVSQSLRAWAQTAGEQSLKAADAAATTARLRDGVVLSALLAGLVFGCWRTWHAVRSWAVPCAAAAPQAAATGVRPVPGADFTHDLPLALACGD